MMTICVAIVGFNCFFFVCVLNNKVFIPLIVVLILFELLGPDSAAKFEEVKEYAMCYIYTPCSYSFVVINCIRAWLLYFDMNLTKLQLQKMWLTIINPNTESSNWFYTHKTTFGNANYMLKYGISIAILLVIFSSILRHSLNLMLVERIVSWGVSLIVIIFTGIIYNKLKESFYNDKLGIRKEMIIMLKSAIFIIIPYLFIECAFYLKWINMKIHLLLYCCIISIGCCVCLVILTLFPKKLNQIASRRKTINHKYPSNQSKFPNLFHSLTDFSGKWTPKSSSSSSIPNIQQGSRKQDQDQKQQLSPRFHVSQHSTSVSLGLDNISSNSSSATPKVRPFGSNWQDIICTTFGFESFMYHLEKEFSIENLLFVSEVYIFIKD